MSILPRFVGLFTALIFGGSWLATAAVDITPVLPSTYGRTVRVSCVGDSITAGFGIGAPADYYPAQLGKMLGSNWLVSNFGGSGATMLKEGNNPYYKYSQFSAALTSNPDVVVIMLGANDANTNNWGKADAFKEDYRWMIRQFRGLASQPRIFICRPCFVKDTNTFGIVESNILAEIPWINELADEEGTGLIDNHAITQDNPSEVPDGVHPNGKGAARIAENTFHALTGQAFPTNVAVRALAGKVTLNWYVSPISAAYSVARATVSGGPYTTLSSNNTAGTFTDANAPIGSTYFYALTTTNIYGALVTSPEIVVPMTVETGVLNRTTGGTALASAGTAGAATDGLDTTDWSTGGNGQTATLQYDYGTYTNWAASSYRLISSSLNAAIDPAAWQFQGSNDGSAWTTLDTQSGQTFSARKQSKRYTINNGLPYRFYRLNITATQGGSSGVALAEFQVSTADSDDVASVSLGTTNQGGAQAFDASNATKWYSGSGNTGWLQYFYGGGAARRLASYAIISASDAPDRDPKNWQFQGSNDGATWTVLDTRSNQVFATRGLTSTYALSASAPYRFYRLDVTANAGAAGNNVGIQIAELRLVLAAAPPLAPSGLTVSIVNGQIVLNWAAGTGAASYTVKRAPASGGPYVTLATALSGTTFVDDSAPLGTAFSYVITASNAAGESPASVSATNADLTPAPVPPIALNAGGTNLGVRLEWTPSAGATSYTVKRSPWNGGPFTTIATGVTTGSYNDSGLLNGTPYYYTVTATGPGGESSPSIQANATPQAAAAVSSLPFLHPLFANNAVLQRDALVPIWGWTVPGSQVSVSIRGQTQITNANANGRWQVQVGPFSADGAAYTLSVTGPQNVTVTNLVFGDVFLFSGQSNMERQLGPRPPQPDVLNYQAEVAAANLPNIRQFSVPEVATARTLQTVNASWSVCTPTTAPNFCAVAFFTARELFQATNVPIGILHSAWGGTRLEPWLESWEAAAYPEFQAAVKALPALTSPGPTSVSGLYGSMIAPLAPFRVKGVVWYQGETSANAPEQYSRLLPSLRRGWRRAFGQPNLPFIVIQLPGYSAAVSTPVQTGSWAEMREAQLNSVTADPYSRLVTTIDIGNSDIHPPNKQDVGKRAALALRNLANEQNLVSQGPLFTGAVVSGATIQCSFSNVGAGLMVGSKTALSPTQQVSGGTLTGFAIAGANKSYVAADAVISGNTVVVSSPSVPAPLYVRYGWANMPTCNLYNKITDSGGTVVDGLPASPFRNDPIARLAVVGGSGSNTYAPGSQVSITSNTVTGGTFIFWSGDAAQLAEPTAFTTTATLNRTYVSVAANYQLVLAPSGVTATPASLSVVLSWTALTNATSYTVKRSASSGGPFVPVASGILTTTWTDVPPAPSTPYFYRIVANNAVGESPESATVTAIPQPAGAPASFTATAGNGLTYLSWNPVASVDSYVVSRSTVNGGPYTPVLARTPGTTYVDPGLNNGTTYYYTVATLSNGVVGPASTASATPSSSTAAVLRSAGGTASASVGNPPNEGAAQAFDGKYVTGNASKWFTAFVAMPQWLQYRFAAGTAWAVTQYDIVSGNDSPLRDPSAWQFQGSMDGTTWTTLDTQTAQSFSARLLAKTYPLTNTTAYPYYRLNITAVAGGGITGLQISELRLFSAPTDQGDKAAPVFGAAPNLSVSAPNANPLAVTFNLTATDVVSGPVTPLCTPASGSLFPAGTTTVNCSAIDAAGNAATTSFTVRVSPPLAAAETVAPAILLNGTAAQMTVQSVAGHTYQLQRSTTLAADSWENIGPATAGGGPLNFSDTPNPAQSKTFYRVLVTP